MPRGNHPGRLTVLAENTVDGRGPIGEHGLSFRLTAVAVFS